MDDSAATVRQLYDALGRRDGDAMAACYHPDAEFRDPAFGTLRGRDVGDMWRMLCARARDLEVEVVRVEGEGPAVDSEVVCRYTFARTGRRVANRIRGTFVVQGGQVVLHHDDFDFPGWAAQALGWRGRLFGRARFIQRKVQAQARAQLRRFQDADQWARQRPA